MSVTNFPNVSAFSQLRKNFSDISTALGTALLEVGEEHRKRVTEYSIRWKFYDADQWGDAEFEATNVTLNYARRIVNIKTLFLMKNSFTIQIPEFADEKGASEVIDRAFVKAALDKQWLLNNKEVWGIEAVQQGSVTGDVFVRVTWNDDDTDPLVPPHVEITLLPSVYVFPEWHDKNPKQMVKCTVIFPVDVDEIRVDNAYSEHLRRNRRVAIYKEVWTSDKVEMFVGDDKVESKPNVLGRVPIVHIQNFPNTNGYYGISDLADVVPIQRNINEKATDISDIIEYHGSPQTVLSGARPDQLERGPDQIWGIPKDAKVSNLELSGDLSANMKYLGILKESMQDVASIPAMILNPTTNISNTPGVALHLSYMPIIEDRRIKELMYGGGIRRINMLVLLLLERFDPKFATKFSKLASPERYSTTIDFGDSLPRDEQLQLSQENQKLSMGITTRKRILMKTEGIGPAEAERIVKEADEDALQRAKIVGQVESTGQDTAAFGKPRLPDPIAQGDKVSLQNLQDQT